MITYFLKGKLPEDKLQNQTTATTIPTEIVMETKVEDSSTTTNPNGDIINLDSSNKDNKLPPETLALSKQVSSNLTETEDLSPDIDLNSNMSNLTAQRRKSLCRQHNISSSFGTTVSSNTSVTPCISNSSSVITIGTLPTIAKNHSSSIENTSEGNSIMSKSNFLPRTALDELKDVETEADKGTHKNSIENLEILLKNNISLSDLNNKQQLNLRANEANRNTHKKSSEMAMVVSFKNEVGGGGVAKRKHRSVTTIMTATTPSSYNANDSNSSNSDKFRASSSSPQRYSDTTHLLKDSSSAALTPPQTPTAYDDNDTNETFETPCELTYSSISCTTSPDTKAIWLNHPQYTQTANHHLQNHHHNYHQQHNNYHSKMKTSQSLSPIGLYSTGSEIVNSSIPNSRSMIVIKTSTSLPAATAAAVNKTDVIKSLVTTSPRDSLHHNNSLDSSVPLTDMVST